MTAVLLPDHHLLTWYLTAEEYFASVVATLPLKSQGSGLWLFWTPPPTVICGRHQDIEAEVNISFCRQHHIDVVRRKSGGGTVYADRGNLMISYISPSAHASDVYADYMSRVSDALRSLGLDAVSTSHNDILVGAHKVSGTACYALPEATIVHGTLLCDVDMNALAQAITPSQSKLAKHAVASVRQRVMNISALLALRTADGTPFSTLRSADITAFIQERMQLALCTCSCPITPTEIAEVDHLWLSAYPSSDE